jgi:hypothetical protein
VGIPNGIRIGQSVGNRLGCSLNDTVGRLEIGALVLGSGLGLLDTANEAGFAVVLSLGRSLGVGRPAAPMTEVGTALGMVLNGSRSIGLVTLGCAVVVVGARGG